MVAMLAEATLLIGGLVVLWWAGDKSVRYAVELTDILGITSFTVGFVILSISTGLPEIATVIITILEDAAPLSAGNLLGSSLVNLSLVLGITAIVARHIEIDRDHERALLTMLALTTVVVFGIVLSADLLFWHGILLLGVYGLSLYVLKRGGLMEKIVKEEEQDALEEEKEDIILGGPKGTVIKFLASLSIVVVGADLTVDAAVTIGQSFGIPLETLGATVVAIGTGLPELTLELNAVRRKEYALALGDIFGSTIVNMSLILGVLAIVNPTPVAILPLLGTLLYLGIAITVVWYGMMKNHGLDWKYGIILLALFILYLIEEIGLATFIYM